MDRFRRRRRAKPLWFPPIGTRVGEALESVGYSTFSLDVSPSGAVPSNFALLEQPLTFDFGQEALLTSIFSNNEVFTLADLQASSWRCRRIVGKLWAAYEPQVQKKDGDTAPPGVIFTAGFMVRTVDESGFPLTQENPLDQPDYDDPWIWRRSWILGQGTGPQGFANSAGTAVQLALAPVDNYTIPEQRAFSSFPITNCHYGSVADGPHVDAKTNRIIGPEERLVLTLTATSLPIQGYAGTPRASRVVGAYDLRLLGMLQRSSNRRNASR